MNISIRDQMKAQSMNPGATLRHRTLAITFVAATAFVVSCRPSAEQSAAADRKTTSAQFAKVNQETTETRESIKIYSFAQKTEFVTTMQGQLDKINHDLDQLAARIRDSGEAAKLENAPKLQALRGQVAQLTRLLDNVRDANESAWDSIKASTQKAFDSLNVGFQQSRQWASDKIAP